MPKSKRDRYRLPSGQYAYYYEKCVRCGIEKGRSKSKLCLSCGHYKPKKDLNLHCPHCKEKIVRDEIVIMLYMAGTGSDTLSKVFGVTKQRILQITRKTRILGLTRQD